MKLFQAMFARTDRRRARDYLQQICDERVIARRAFDEKTRLADRALLDAKDLEREEFRRDFFGCRNPVRQAFTACNPWVCALPEGYFKGASR